MKYFFIIFFGIVLIMVWLLWSAHLAERELRRDSDYTERQKELIKELEKVEPDRKQENKIEHGKG